MIIQTNDSAILSGGLARDAETKTFTKQGDDGQEKTNQLVTISVAVDKKQENGENKTIWANVYAWGSMLSGLKKGDKVLITGKKELNTYTGDDGAEHSNTRIRADFVLVMPKSNNGSQPTQAVQTQTLVEQTDFGELPF